MATEIAHSFAKQIDPSKPATYSVQFSPYQGHDNTSKPLSAVRYNHKPSQTLSKRSTIITKSPDPSGTTLELIIRDDDGRKTSKCKYIGKRIPSERDVYSLVFHGDEQKMTLDHIQSQYNFNLRSAPWQTDGDILTQDYSQLAMADEESLDAYHIADMQSEEEDLVGEDLPALDSNNSFDYRHFLSNFLHSSRPSPVTPAAIPKALERVKDNISKKRTPVATSILSTSKPSKTKAPARKPLPKVRVQRRASVKQPSPEHSDIDDGGLTIEFDTDSRSRKKQLLGTSLSGQPVSLRSIASSNSPASFVASPLWQVNASERDEDHESNVEDEEGNYDETGDEDIEMMQLPSPAAAIRAAMEHQGSLDVDDALEAELALALEQAEDDEEILNDDGEGVVAADSTVPLTQVRVEDSESESEEE